MELGIPFRLRPPQAAVWWTLAAGLAATAALGWHLHGEAVGMDRQRLAMRAAEVTSQLDARLEKTEMLLQNLRDYLTLSGETRNSVFARWCYENGLSINCPWLHGIAVATNRNEAHWRSQLPQPPETWTAADWGTFDRLARRKVIDCTIALTSEVKDGKRFLADYDLVRLGRDFSDLFANTIHNARLRMSTRREVMLDANSNRISGALFFAPVYRPEAAEFLTIEGLKLDQIQHARWVHLTSVILAPVDFKVLAQSVWDGSPSDLVMELFSSTNQTAKTWLNGSDGAPRAADPKFKAYLTHRQIWPMYGEKFSIFFSTTPLFEAQSPRRLAKSVMAAGIGLTLLATALVGVALRARSQQEMLTDQIREARDALAAAQEEREKFSRDLHDGTIQSLYAIQLGLGHTVERLEAEPATARREFSTVRRDLDAVIAEIRQFITVGDDANKSVDFSAVLRALVQRMRNGTPARMALHCDPGASGHLSGDRAVQLANIAREALSNSLRHAKPRDVEITLRLEADTVVLVVSDDGRGFDPRARRRSGFGLGSMTARTRDMGGTMEIQSAPGKGTRVVFRIPASPPGLADAEGPDRPGGAA